jgi:phosphoribosylanthranilate isomerase
LAGFSAGGEVVEVKFCGVTRPADAGIAVELGARYVGVIFAASPRQVTPERAVEILAPARGSDVAVIGVFDKEAPDDVLATAEAAMLDGVQLHGSPTEDEISVLRERFDGQIWAVRRIGAHGLNGAMQRLFEVADGVVLDTLSPRDLGGTGETFDWTAVAATLAGVRRDARLIVAGGLRPENVRHAVDALRPDVVDVSSGVESAPGQKDPARMRAFVAAVRASVTR